MPLFHYKMVNHDGDVLEGSMDGPSRNEVAIKLQNAGNIPLHIAETTGQQSRTIGLSFFRSQQDRISQKDIPLFTRELATILEAGLALDHALATLEQLASKPAMKKMIGRINQRIKAGSSFSAALEAQGKTFNALYLNTVRAGEAGGALAIVLDRLADYLERSAEIRSVIVSALFYPIILSVVALLSIIALLTYVVPQFVPLFADVGQALPFLTQVVFGVAELLRQYWWLLLATFALLVWLLDRRLQNPAFRYQLDAFLLRLPLVGELIVKLNIARFARTLSTLLANGVAMLVAISIVREVIGNKVLAKAVAAAEPELERGNSLAKPLTESQHFPPLALQLIRVGEETGQLEKMLSKVADIYEKESQVTIKRLLILLEPVLILGLGAVIAVIIISILLAILGLNDLVI